jgi:hypothetical protein
LQCEHLEARDVPATLFVAPDGIDAPGRGDAAAPLHTLQFAADQANSGDTLLVAGGTYTYNAAVDTHTDVGSKQVLTLINKQLAIFGGFSRGDNFAVSNPQANPTVIDGQGQFRGILALGIGSPAGVDLEGITIRNGLGLPFTNRTGTDLGGFYAFGGAVYIDNGGVPTAATTSTFRNDTFENNHAVGGSANGTFNYGGNAAGGAMALAHMQNVVMDNVIFRGNVAQGGGGGERGGGALGGALHANFSTITGTNVLFESNQALGGNGTGSGRAANETADALGGAVALQLSVTATFDHTQAVGNQAVGGTTTSTDTSSVGGAAFGGAFFNEADVSLTLRDSVVFNNKALGNSGGTGGLAGGGGIETDHADLTLDRVKVLNNLARGGGPTTPNGAFGATGGGGLYLTSLNGNNPNNRGRQDQITNSVVAGNQAQLFDGAPATVGGGGGGIWIQGTSVTVTQSTVADNSLGANLTDGPGILVISDGAPSPGQVNLSYSIVAGNQAANTRGTVYVRGGGVNYNRNLFFNNSLPDTFPDTGATVNGAATNITGDPKFNSVGSPNFDYSIQAGSAAADQAVGSTTAVDISNAPRTGTPDLGAFELGTAGSFPAVTTPTGAGSTTGPSGPPPSPPAPPSLGNTAMHILLAGGTDNGVINIYTINPDGTIGAPRPFQAFPGFAGPVRVAAADVNGDGVADYVLGIGPGGGSLVRVINGATGTDLVPSISAFESSFTGGVFVAATDIDGDGKAEVAVSPDEGGGGRIRVFSLQNGSLATVADFFGIDDPNFRGGARVATGDVNGDSKPDLIVGAGFGGGPRVAIFDGARLLANGGAPPKLIGDFLAFPGADAVSLRNGVFVTSGDFNGDGSADLAFGGGPGGAPRVFVLNGAQIAAGNVDAAQNSPLANFFVANDTTSRGGVRLTVKDVDRDNKADLVVGSGEQLPSAIRVYLGKDFTAGGEPALAAQVDPFNGSPRAGVFVG